MTPVPHQHSWPWQCRTTAAPHLGRRQLQVKAVGVRSPNGDAGGGRHALGHLRSRRLAHCGAAGRGEEGKEARGIVGGRRGGCCRDGPGAIGGSRGRLEGGLQVVHSRANFFEGHGSCKGVGAGQWGGWVQRRGVGREQRRRRQRQSATRLGRAHSGEASCKCRLFLIHTWCTARVAAAGQANEGAHCVAWAA